ncbi:SDR family NAD(P)-dependent oxidoreductase, partial [Shinella sp.]|uniref:SDR family NAD(P)-dependent oxidoreductase n=1 Tax=Shinella sp. TaxID=1870904 RepID=UPI002896E888
MTILDRFSQKGRVALVAGGGRGLGFEIALGLAQAGAHVVVTGRNAATLEEAVSRIAAGGGQASAAAFDIADRAAQRRALADIEARHGRLDVLVNNVGARDRRALADMDDAAIDDLILTDLS